MNAVEADTRTKGSGRSGLPPGPRMPAVAQTLNWVVRPQRFLERCRERYGDIFTIKIAGSGTWVVCADPEDLKRVFTGDPNVMRAGEGNTLLRPVLGPYAIITQDGEEHLRVRKLVLPPFHGERMQSYGDVIVEATRKQIESWPVGEPFPLSPSMRTITLDVIVRAIFGIDDPQRAEQMLGALGSLLDGLGNARALARAIYLSAERLERNRGFRAMIDPVDEAILVEVRRRRGESGLAEREDILSMLVQARYADGSAMSDEELVSVLKALLVAGHDTTATALAWAFERLLRYEDVFARLLEEVLAGESEAYLDAVVKETLRIRDVFPITPPRVLADSVEIAGYTIPAGAQLVAGIHLVHNDPNVYPEPERFLPERFLDRQPGTYTLIPFGGGVRRCIGAAFAQFEMKKVLETVLKEVELRAVDAESEKTMRRMVILTPNKGARAIVVRRRAGAARGPSAAAAVPVLGPA